MTGSSLNLEFLELFWYLKGQLWRIKVEHTFSFFSLEGGYEILANMSDLKEYDEQKHGICQHVGCNYSSFS